MAIHPSFFPLVMGLALGATGPAAAKSYKQGQDQFTVDYTYTVPPLAKGDQVEVWLPLASTDAFQTVGATTTAPGLAVESTVNANSGNHFLHAKADASAAGKSITVAYTVTRREKATYPAAAEVNDPAYLRSEPLMPLNDRFKKLALEITQGKASAEEKGQAIYNYVLKEMRYDKSGSGWGRGDAVYACDSKAGNCTDFHALFIVLARSVGIPARFAIGFTIPSQADAGPIEGYHCWAEFAANGSWIPVDISEASKDPTTKDYYFGHHPANRFQLTKGQQIELVPASSQGPLTFLVHPYVEINGKAVKGAKGTYAFKRLAAPQSKT